MSPVPSQIAATLTRPLFSKLRCTALSFQFSVTAPQLARLAYELQRTAFLIAPPGSTVINLRGIDDSLFSVRASIPQGDEESSIVEYRLSTAFDGFKRSGAFLHTIQEHSAGEIPAHVRPRDLTWLAPVFTDEVRLGVEVYGPHFFSSSLGFAPVIREHVSIVARDSSARVELRSDRAPDDDCPISHSPLWETFNHAIQISTGLLVQQVWNEARLSSVS